MHADDQATGLNSTCTWRWSRPLRAGERPTTSTNIRASLEVTQLHVKVDELHDKVLARIAALEGRGSRVG